jgi:hypothetical protein
VVGGAAYAAGRHGGRQRGYDEGYDDAGQDQQQMAPPPQAAAAPPAAAPSTAIDYDQLAELGKLHADGTLTDEEFAAAKAKILGS